MKAQKELVGKIELFMFKLRKRVIQPKKRLEKAKGILKKTGMFFLR